MLSLSVSKLALWAGGTARKIMLTNTGTYEAKAVTYTVTPALPAGTTISPAACGPITAGGSCILTITPGATPTAAPGDAAPISVALSAQGENTNVLSTAIDVLGYGSVYQSGYLFAVDDTTVDSGSVGGKVAALLDQAPPSNGLIWSSNGNPGNADFSAIPGITEIDSTSGGGCNGATDGACNTGKIIEFYSPPNRSPAVNPTYYAAGLCQGTIGGYSDWYLPAVCEMGYGSSCGTSTSPAVQNMQSNLVDNGIVGDLTGDYWSSTQYSPVPPAGAWGQFFQGSGGSNQFATGKSSLLGVRCVRSVVN